MMLLSALIIAAVGLLLALWFVFGMGYRGKKLVYCILVILFTGLCLWGLINIDEIEILLRDSVGVWGTSGIFLLIALAVWLAMKFLF